MLNGWVMSAERRGTPFPADGWRSGPWRQALPLRKGPASGSPARISMARSEIRPLARACPATERRPMLAGTKSIASKMGYNCVGDDNPYAIGTLQVTMFRRAYNSGTEMSDGLTMVVAGVAVWAARAVGLPPTIVNFWIGVVVGLAGMIGVEGRASSRGTRRLGPAWSVGFWLFSRVRASSSRTTRWDGRFRSGAATGAAEITELISAGVDLLVTALVGVPGLPLVDIEAIALARQLDQGVEHGAILCGDRDDSVAPPRGEADVAAVVETGACLVGISLLDAILVHGDQGSNQGPDSGRIFEITQRERRTVDHGIILTV